jgi:hypothetical protein
MADPIKQMKRLQNNNGGPFAEKVHGLCSCCSAAGESLEAQCTGLFAEVQVSQTHCLIVGSCLVQK